MFATGKMRKGLRPAVLTAVLLLVCTSLAAGAQEQFYPFKLEEFFYKLKIGTPKEAVLREISVIPLPILDLGQKLDISWKGKNPFNLQQAYVTATLSLFFAHGKVDCLYFEDLAAGSYRLRGNCEKYGPGFQ